MIYFLVGYGVVAAIHLWFDPGWINGQRKRPLWRRILLALIWPWSFA